MRDSRTTIYTKGVRITEESYLFLIKTKGKKSIAGRLEEILYGQRNLQTESPRTHGRTERPSEEDTS